MERLMTKTRMTPGRPPSPWTLGAELKQKWEMFQCRLERRFPRSDVQGAMQDGLVRVWNMSKRRDIRNPSGYFYTIVSKILAEQARAGSLEPVTCDSSLAEEAMVALFHGHDPAKEFERQRTAKELITPAPKPYCD